MPRRVGLTIAVATGWRVRRASSLTSPGACSRACPERILRYIDIRRCTARLFTHPSAYTLQAILVLGGDGERERLAATMAAGTYCGEWAEVAPFTGRKTPKEESHLFAEHMPYSCMSLNQLCSSLPVYVSSGHSNVNELIHGSIGMKKRKTNAAEHAADIVVVATDTKCVSKCRLLVVFEYIVRADARSIYTHSTTSTQVSPE
eukprot:7798541-Pyramimonas_sp.AAC.1